MAIDTAFAQEIVERARRRGASASEVIVREATEFSVSVRLGEVETLTQSASKALGLRVLVDNRQASLSTSDFSDEALDRVIEEALALARVTSPDDTADLPDRAQLATETIDLDLFDSSIDEMSADAKIELALRGERAARDADARISNFDRGSLDTAASRTVFANSQGFAGAYDASSISHVVVPVAESGGDMQRGYWYDMRRHAADLDSPEEIGRRAAERTLRRLGARKVASREVPIVFDPTTARDLVGTIFSSVSGESIFRKSSFLVNSLGERVAAPGVTVVDDGALPRALGSRPFDGEGLPTRRTTVIEDGRLENFLLNTYTGRKLGRPSTGNAARGLVGATSVGAGNMYLAAGTVDPKEIVGSIADGFYVTELVGFGVNVVTGDYSRGATGMWIENGELAYPVHEVTIAGNLKDMLRGISMVGSDLEFRGRLAAPTLCVDRMVVSGQ